MTASPAHPLPALRAAFPLTLPVMAGYLFLGIAYGVLMQHIGLGAGWTLLMSALIYAGSMQYLAVSLLAASFDPLSALLLTLAVNARHLFYGLSMLRTFAGLGRFRPYLIFALSDETFSILCAHTPPEGIDRGWFSFFVALLNQLYWILGSLCGAWAGHLLPFNTTGLDFALTAMFFVSFLNQCDRRDQRPSAAVGVGCSLLCLLLFGADRFIIPAMLLILAVFALEGRIRKGGAAS